MAQLEKWNALAKKWFKNHGDDLRKKFRTKWSGSDGRFQKEIKKLERSFNRKCSTKKSTPKWMKNGADHLNEADLQTLDEQVTNSTDASDTSKKRRSDDDLTIVHNSGARMLHIVNNIEHWIEAYLKKCGNTDRIVKRWKRFVAKWKHEIEKNPIFQEEIEEDERFLRQQDAASGRSGARRCGELFSQFGLNGRRYTIYDASVDRSQEIDHLGYHPLGNDELMSVKPYPG